MPFLINDFFRMTNYFEKAGNSAVMVSYWRLVNVVDFTNNSDFAQAMAKQMMTSANVAGAMSSTAKHVRTVLDNLTHVLEFGEWVGDIAGETGGDPAADFVALSLKQIVPTRLTRNGYKRIPFPSETNTANNTPNVSTTDKLSIEAFFGAESHVFWVMDDGTIEVDVQPVVIGRTNVGTPESPDYILDLAKVQAVSGASLYKVTSQVSRKV